MTASLVAALVRTRDYAEFHRALGAATIALAAELERTDLALAARLGPTLSLSCARADVGEVERRHGWSQF